MKDKKQYKIKVLMLIAIFFSLSLLMNTATVTKKAEGLNANFCGVDINSNFAYDRIIVTLTRDATLNKDYTVEDFSNIGAVAISDLTGNNVNWVRKKVYGIKAEEEKLIDVDEFKRILCIELAEKSKENVLASIEKLKNRDDVELATPDYVYEIQGTFNDAFVGQQWALDNINVFNAWDISTGSSEILVAVIDSGISGGHPDLIDSIAPNRVGSNWIHRDFVGQQSNNGDIIQPMSNSFSTIGNAVEPYDDNGHGTKVAGIIAAQGNNGIGIVGVAPNVKLVSLKVIDANGYGSLSSITNAVNWCAENNIPIANFSGGTFIKDETLETAINNYEGLFVVAAGNYSKDIDEDGNEFYPAKQNSNNMIVVGSITHRDGMHKTNYGATSVDLFAPGIGIYTTVISQNKITGEKEYGYSNDYYNASGTSFAAPFVTGVAALLLSHNPTLSTAQIKNAILNNVTAIPSLQDKCVTGGKLNAEAALKSLGYKTEDNGEGTVKIVEPYFTPSGNIRVPEELNGKTVTEIGANAFKGSINLTSITLPRTITSIKTSAFEGCNSLESVTFSNLYILTNIEERAFYGCSSLTSIALPYSLTYIGNKAFEGCGQLQTVNIKQDGELSEIGENAFKGCTSLTKISIPMSVVEIGNYAFSGCSNLATVYLLRSEEEGITQISNTAFSDCDKLKSIRVPGKENEIAYKAQLSSVADIISYYTSGLNYTYVNYSAYSVSKGETQIDGELVIPDLYNNISITEISDNAFSECVGITNVIIPNTITSIGDNAFYGCSALQAIRIPNSVTEIGVNAFASCTNLTTVYLPENIVQLDDSAFLNCTNLTKIIVPNKTSVYNAYRAQFDSQDLKDLVVCDAGDFTFTLQTNGTYEIKVDASKKSNLSGVLTIPSSYNGIAVTKIADYGFSGCTRITQVNIPSSILELGIFAFSGCTGVAKITLPTSLTAISEYAFSGCTSLISAHIPPTVTVIGKRAFSGCTSLENLYLPSGVVTIGEYAFSATKIRELTLPISLVTVEKGAFSDCESLWYVVVSESVQSIGGNAFAGCEGLNCVTLNRTAAMGITIIPINAFANCKNLLMINVLDEESYNAYYQSFSESEFLTRRLTGIMLI